MLALPWQVYGREAGGPSGALYASAADLGRWLAFQLGEGSAAGWQPHATHIPHTPLAEAELPDWPAQLTAAGRRAEPVGYGLGWYAHDVDGQRLVHHSGGSGGYCSWAALLPELGFGVAVLLNGRSGNALNAALALMAVDRALGAAPLDWPTLLRPAPGSAGAASVLMIPAAAHAARQADVPATLSPTELAGGYTAPVLGLPVTITPIDDGLSISAGRMQGRLSHWSADTWRLTVVGRLELPYEDLVTFHRSTAGTTAALHAPIHAPIYANAARTAALKRLRQSPAHMVCD
jgi:hypothetical protein